MPSIAIVTDSSAHTTSAAPFRSAYVVPHRITIGGRTYREHVDLTAEDAFLLLSASPSTPPVLHPPTAADYAALFTRLAQDYDAIISLHASREILASWAHGRVAAAQLPGYGKIEIIDTRTISAGQAMLVRLAENAVEQGQSLDEIVRLLRGAVERVYSIYYVDTMELLEVNQIMPPSHTILGGMLGIKPMLTIEEGRLTPIEKVRTRAQAVDRLVEFAVEFVNFEEAVILQNRAAATEQTRMLNERLALEFADRPFAQQLYGPSLAALIGPDALGLVILESETKDEGDDYD
ncbi:MAG: DegV family protein [Blastochloris sp.]|nr:DegV family protein [Blastochloris sp.]